MSHVEDFLTAEEEAEVVDAIVQAERNTSGEIRVHLEATTKMEPYLRAQEIFRLLKMDNTKEDNGVLIYVAVEDKKFAVCGDKGIHMAVPEDFWDSTKDIMQSHFQKGQFKQGLVAGILKAGQELKTHFPWQQDDTNELSNEISKG
ncbi:TPM domain-containing protein [Flavobacteriaceae bacterium F89]|uniref:TPM domain-containing protein n=1 Tax=Cerina litoralis TaxID=2874477 RepID=A0AAE3JQ28_9FLAO|nr:TPM domain-containing protein [Cerina litoralis]MCG2459793.1 TPM domain-containing protein [Cerina litoralis]